jgi:hypothetical protein
LRLPFSHHRKFQQLILRSNTTVPLPLIKSSDPRRQRMANEVYIENAELVQALVF